MKYIKYTLGLALVLTLQANAQGVSPAAMEQLKMQRLWLNSQNAAGMVFDDATNFSNLHVDYNQENGNFHRPQEGEKTTGIGVSSEGFMKMKNALVWGAFSFMQRNLTDAGYNASITDPFRGMPYYIIDEHLSNWLTFPSLYSTDQQPLGIRFGRHLPSLACSQTTRPPCGYPFLYPKGCTGCYLSNERA